MGRDEALRILREARETEEKSMPIYTKHLSSAVFWTGISPEAAAKAKKVLQRLADESAAHKVMVEELIHRLEREV